MYASDILVLDPEAVESVDGFYTGNSAPFTKGTLGTVERELCQGTSTQPQSNRF